MLHRTCLVAATVAWIPAARAGAPVAYSKIDASTVRVFAVGTVGVTTIDGAGEPIQVAMPQAGHGTGFAVEPELVVTAQHVIEGARHVVVRRPGAGGFLPARVVYANADDDIAVLHVDTRLPRIKMRADRRPLRVRQTVYAVGYPLDPARTQAQSARGIIAGHLEDASLQVDINLNPGNSGGPLVDEHDAVVGMVIARGDVKKGVQGIGVAVPIAKLRTAVARARREVAAGHVPALSEHDTRNAAIVDHLVQTGALAFGDQFDLGDDFDGAQLDNQVDVLCHRVDDSDLLIFLAGNLWNTSLSLEHKKIKALGERALTAKEAQELSAKLRGAAVRLARRGTELDRTLAKRSRFVDVVLRNDDADDVELTDAPDDPTPRRRVAAIAPGDAPAIAATAARTAERAWTVGATTQLRLGERATGGGLEVGRILIGAAPATVRPFARAGASVGMVSRSGADPQAQSFAAVELGGGLRVAVGRTAQLDIYAGLAPSYVATSRDILMMHHTSDYALDHLRASVTLRLSWFSIAAGVRSIQGTSWLEPIGVGVTF